MKPAELAAILRPFLLADMAQVAASAAAQADRDARYLRRYRIRLYDPSGPTLAEYEPTSAGLADAIAAALTAGGGTIQLPPGTYQGNHTIPAGVTLVGLTREECVLMGQVTLSDGSHLGTLTVDRDEDDAGAICGVVEGSGGITATLREVTVNMANATGPAYAVYVANGGTITAHDCDLLAETGSEGYAAYVTSGTFRHYGGMAVGTVSLEPYFV